MKRSLYYGIFLLLFTLTGSCTSDKKPPEMADLSKMKADTITIRDPNSYANSNDVRVTHLIWEAEVDFDHQTIHAKAIWAFKKIKNSADRIILDTGKLRIKKVTLDGSIQTKYELGKESPLYGQALTIFLAPETRTIEIEYSTDPEAAALQWLNPQQTAGKKLPYLFTQSQAILARTWLPCQDGPGARFTYEATVKVPKNLLALMSASNPKEKSTEGIYHFTMDQPLPSYLMSLAVGDITYQKLSEHTGIYSEPSVLAGAAEELESIPDMVRRAGEMYGPYQWGQYDVLVLPPSFPFGGMENPRLTFATPTILAGDKSLVALIAHELAHSWSGNLVTNANWEEIWINEGFTVYFEHRIMEALRGRDYSEMLASLAYQDLTKEINYLTENGRAADTRLKIDLKDRDPDEGLTDIPYNKGYFFLRKIEETLGREVWDRFLQRYFSVYAFHSMDTETLIGLLEKYIIQGNQKLADVIRIKEWIYGEGLPDNALIPVTDRFESIDRQTGEFLTSGSIEILQAPSKEWSTHEWLHFINNLPENIGTKTLTQIDQAFDLTHSTNAEIQAAWYEISIREGYTVVYPQLKDFLIHVGRRKFLTPLYTALTEAQEGRNFALEVYREARPNYHPVSYQTIDQLLK